VLFEGFEWPLIIRSINVAEVASIFLACTSATSTLLKYVSFEKPAIELQFERWHGEGDATSDLVEPRPREGVDFVLQRSLQRRRNFDSESESNM
jgi:hypothetical protein